MPLTHCFFLSFFFSFFVLFSPILSPILFLAPRKYTQLIFHHLFFFCSFLLLLAGSGGPGHKHGCAAVPFVLHPVSHRCSGGVRVRPDRLLMLVQKLCQNRRGVRVLPLLGVLIC